MPEFISKLQYKNCEDGEYYDEKPRNLEETLELIKNFPWQREQYADLGLTGPSVTILDKKGNHLKAGIYYGGRFSLYYFDTSHHFYDYRNITIDKVYDAVTDFFNGYVRLDNFEKHIFEPGKKRYFITEKFDYRVNPWKVLLLTIIWDLYFILFSVLSIVFLIKIREPFGLLFAVVAIPFGYIIILILWKCYFKRGQHLQISRGNDEFFFGDSADENVLYNKTDIDKITRYDDTSGRSPNTIDIFEILFKDGSTIVFTNSLISGTTLASKFSDKWKLKIGLEQVGLVNFLRMIP